LQKDLLRENDKTNLNYIDIIEKWMQLCRISCLYWTCYAKWFYSPKKMTDEGNHFYSISAKEMHLNILSNEP
jgi:hypothetical protein